MMVSDWTRRARSLRSGELPLVTRMAITALNVRILLPRQPLPLLLERLDPGPLRERYRGPTPERIVVLARGLVGTGSLLGGTCLARSLVLFRYLRRAGVPATIHFGIKKEGDRIAGHSWVEDGTGPVAEDEEPTHAFRVIYSYPPAAPGEPRTAPAAEESHRS